MATETTTPGLEHYLAVRRGEILPRFQQMRASAIAWNNENAWTRHDQALVHWRSRSPASRFDTNAFPSLLDLKIALAERELKHCDLCPHHCGVNRSGGEIGFCGVGAETAVHWEGILHGEEIELVPSHEVFLSGCTMRCAFCYSHDHIVRPMSGLKMAPQEIASCASVRHSEGAANLNLVGGEPIVHIPNILRALRSLEEPIPIVWNSNLYATSTAMALLDGVVDLYLGDVHFGTPECAWRLGRIPDYLPSVQAAFVQAVQSGASVIIRHLVIPGHLECCARPAMEWATQCLPNTPFHLMFQYLPDFRTIDDPLMGRPLRADEIFHARQMAAEIGVNLYAESEAMGSWESPMSLSNTNTAIGDSVDILIHADGSVGFTRLLPNLVSVAAALNASDERITKRMKRVIEQRDQIS